MTLQQPQSGFPLLPEEDHTCGGIDSSCCKISAPHQSSPIQHMGNNTPQNYLRLQ